MCFAAVRGANRRAEGGNGMAVSVGRPWPLIETDADSAHAGSIAGMDTAAAAAMPSRAPAQSQVWRAIVLLWFRTLRVLFSAIISLFDDVAAVAQFPGFVFCRDQP